MPSAARLLAAFAFGQIEDKGNALLSGFVELSRTNQHRHAAPVLPDVFLFIWLKGTGQPHLGRRTLGAVLPFRCGEGSLGDGTVDKVFAVISHDPQERVIDVPKRNVLVLRRPANELPSEDADDVGIDQAPDPRLAFGKVAKGSMQVAR